MKNYLQVNKEIYSKDDLNSLYRNIEAIPEMIAVEGKLIALCIKHPFELIGLVNYIAGKNGSSLLLNPGIPFEAAYDAAEKAGCNYLIYENCQRVIEVCKNNNEIEPSLFQYSSGTTGEPKLVQRYWKNIRKEITFYNKAAPFYNNERPLVLVPVSHSFGLIAGVLTAIERETEPIIMTVKNPKFIAQIIKSTDNLIIYGVPFLFHILDSLKGVSLQYNKVLSSGSPLSKNLLKSLQQKSNMVLQQYGCSEVGCISIGADIKSSFEVGKALGYLDVKVNGNKEQPDEIIVSFDEYTIHTNDMGYFSDSNSLHILGRCDDIINVSGLMVIPSDVEDVINKMQQVSEVVVYKTKHKVWGEAVKAMVVANSNLTKDKIRAWCIKHLPPYKVPGDILLVSEIPKTSTGKICRKLLQ